LIENKINELYDDQASLVHELISPAVGLRLQEQNLLEASPKIKDHNFIKSKIGGMPDVEEDFSWPEFDNLPLTFLAQINLTEVSSFNSELPSKGVLYFFVANGKSEDYSQLVNNIRVIYLENDILKSRWIDKAKESERKEAYPIEFYQHYTLPSYQEKIIVDSEFYSGALEKLEDLEFYISELTQGDEDYTRHHMLGDPNAIQGAVRMFWGAAMFRPKDIYYEELNEYMDLAEKIGEEFVLLLQIDLYDKRINVSNYSDNYLYFGIHKEDLKNRNFDNTKLVMQNT